MVVRPLNREGLNEWKLSKVSTAPQIIPLQKSTTSLVSIRSADSMESIDSLGRIQSRANATVHTDRDETLSVKTTDFQYCCTLL